MIIFIGTYYSKCLACGQFADFHDISHISIPGDSVAVGCGVKWDSFDANPSFQQIAGDYRKDLKFSGENIS